VQGSEHVARAPRPSALQPEYQPSRSVHLPLQFGDLHPLFASNGPRSVKSPAGSVKILAPARRAAAGACVGDDRRSADSAAAIDGAAAARTAALLLRRAGLSSSARDHSGIAVRDHQPTRIAMADVAVAAVRIAQAVGGAAREREGAARADQATDRQGSDTRAGERSFHSFPRKPMPSRPQTTTPSSGRSLPSGSALTLLNSASPARSPSGNT
jgi:hypothetical protein